MTTKADWKNLTLLHVTFCIFLYGTVVLQIILNLLCCTGKVLIKPSVLIRPPSSCFARYWQPCGNQAVEFDPAILFSPRNFLLYCDKINTSFKIWPRIFTKPLNHKLTRALPSSSLAEITTPVWWWQTHFEFILCKVGMKKFLKLRGNHFELSISFKSPFVVKTSPDTILQIILFNLSTFDNGALLHPFGATDFTIFGRKGLCIPFYHYLSFPWGFPITQECLSPRWFLQREGC